MIIIKQNKNKTLLFDEFHNEYIIIRNNIISHKHKNIESALVDYHNIEYDWDTIVYIMDNIDLEDYGLFKCRECGEVLDISDKCTEHDNDEPICRNCCELCRTEEMRCAEIERIIDENKLNT